MACTKHWSGAVNTTIQDGSGGYVGQTSLASAGDNTTVIFDVLQQPTAKPVSFSSPQLGGILQRPATFQTDPIVGEILHVSPSTNRMIVVPVAFASS